MRSICIDGATMLCTDPFRFCDLPTEVRLNILEYTDLLTPTREVRWDPITGYKVQPRGRWENRAWQPPRALFLVSKAFYTQARKIFFKHNQIVVWPHVSAFAGQPGSPADYAATTFFADALTAGSFRHLRHLEFPAFPAIGPRGKETGEQARNNWLRALQRVYDNGGLDNLRFLRITGSWDDAPSPASFLFMTATDVTTDFMKIRNFVEDRIWPLINPEHGPPRLPLQLWVEMQGREFNQSQYSIRKRGGQRHERADTLSVGGRFISRVISWKPPDHLNSKGYWVEDAQDGEWIEEAWMKGTKRRDQRYSHVTQLKEQ
ncbi:hypothetical protein F4859DRAFT_526887 [Xylaria cf. heliscus]|nr:hypothetical protein F4859DRAFT_526887 [Xylaria cf. heliscus]